MPETLKGHPMTAETYADEALITHPWLSVWRGLWWVLAAIGLIIVVLSVPGFVGHLRPWFTQETITAELWIDPGVIVVQPTPLLRIVTLLSWLANIFTVLLYLSLAILIFLRRSESRIAMIAAFYLLATGVFSAGPVGALDYLLPGIAELNVEVLQAVVGTVPTLLLMLTFPDGRFVPYWSRWLLVLGVVITAISTVVNLLAEGSLVEVLNIAWVPVLLLIIGVQIYRFRRVSNTVERQQTKWVIFGFGLNILIFSSVIVFPTSLPASTSPEQVVLYDSFIGSIWGFGIMAIPICLAIAILQFRLWDIDIIIRRTLQYGVVSAILGAVYFGSIVVVQGIFRSLTGTESSLAIVISTLLIAALFNPVRARIQQVIDRTFFRRRYDADVILADFAEAMRDEVNLVEIQEQLVTTVSQTLEPEYISLTLLQEVDHA